LGCTGIDKKLDVGELKQWLGYALAVSIHSGIPLDKLWSDSPAEESLLPPPCLGRHGMSIKRFKRLRSVLTFCKEDAATLEEDPWAFVRPLVDQYNQSRTAKISAVELGRGP
jgi:hypothetical protein